MEPYAPNVVRAKATTKWRGWKAGISPSWVCGYAVWVGVVPAMLEAPPVGVEDGVTIGAEKYPEEDESGEDQQTAQLAAAFAAVGEGVVWIVVSGHLLVEG